MDLSRQEYPAMLDSMDPPTAVNVLTERVKHVGRLNTEIADWLAERRRIEDAYVSSLRKLAQKEPPNDSSELGVFTTPWQKIINSAARLAESHQTLASQIEANVERPLRTYATRNREMQAMSTMQGNLQSLAKDYESTQKKVDKRGESGRAEFENASSQWTSQAPYVFEALQALDESRCNFLRDSLTQFETLEVELVEKNQKTAENVLNSILSVDTANEVRTFVARTSGAGAPRAPPSRRLSRSATGATLPPLPAPVSEELSRQQTPTGQVEKKSRLGGLKRLGTVMSRRKSVQPQQLGKGSSNSDLAENNFGSSTRSTGSRLRPTRGDSLARIPSSSPPPNPPSSFRMNGERPRATRDMSESSLGQVSPPLGPPPSQRAYGFDSAPVSRDLAGIDLSSSQPLGVNGTGLAEPPSLQDSRRLPPTNGVTIGAISRDMDGFSVPPPATDDISRAQAEADAEAAETQKKVLLRDAPIAEDKAESEAAMATMANKLREQAAPPRRTNTTRGRRDVRSAIFTPSQIPNLAAPSDETARSKSQQRQLTSPSSTFPISESPEQTPSQPQTFARDLQSSSGAGGLQTSSSMFATPFISSLYGQGQPSVGQAQSPFPPNQPQTGQGESSISDLASPVAQPQPSFSPTVAQTNRPSYMDETSDTQSVRSARSTGTSATGPPVRHPELQSAGLSSSVIETVSAWFSNGSLTRATLIGELALAYNGDVASPGSYILETIRLENFNSLEKVAPNPAFVSPVSGDKPGEYTIDVTALPRTTVAFKYQVHLESSVGGMAAQAPLLFMPTWRVEATQASAILTYGPSPALTEPVTLQNVVIAMSVDGTSARSCMSKPTGTFSRERNMIYWRIEKLTLTPGAAGQKLLARFATDSEAKPGKVEARWEVNGNVGALGSGLGVSRLEAAGSDPFADHDESATTANWGAIEMVRKVGSGTYVSN